MSYGSVKIGSEVWRSTLDMAKGNAAKAVIVRSASLPEALYERGQPMFVISLLGC